MVLAANDKAVTRVLKAQQQIHKRWKTIQKHVTPKDLGSQMQKLQLYKESEQQNDDVISVSSSTSSLTTTLVEC